MAASKRQQFVLQLQSDFLAKLPLPSKFVQQHLRVADCQEVSLCSPSGKFWLVKLTQSGQQLYLDKLWDKFVQFHGLTEGCSLLFRYEGSMVFSVKVFDLSGCLKEYVKFERYYSMEQVLESEEHELQTNNACINPDNQLIDADAPEQKRRKSNVSSASSFSEEPARTRSAATRLALPSTNHEASRFEKKVAPCEVRDKFIRMPKSFCVANKFQTGSLIILKDIQDRESHVFLRRSGGVYILGKGIEKFMDENNVKAGDFFICELRSTGVMRGWMVKESSYKSKLRASHM